MSCYILLLDTPVGASRPPVPVLDSVYTGTAPSCDTVNDTFDRLMDLLSVLNPGKEESPRKRRKAQNCSSEGVSKGVPRGTRRKEENPVPNKLPPFNTFQDKRGSQEAFNPVLVLFRRGEKCRKEVKTLFPA